MAQELAALQEAKQLHARLKASYNLLPESQRLDLVDATLEADLEAGKIYYAIATVRMGVWKARFSLHPFKQDHPKEDLILGSEQMVAWLEDCTYVQPNEASKEYARKIADDLKERREEYAEKWARFSPEALRERTLKPQDGVTAPVL